jgi:hypothetical protein
LLLWKINPKGGLSFFQIQNLRVKTSPNPNTLLAKGKDKNPLRVRVRVILP